VLLPQEIIRRKRDGCALSGDEIRAFIAGVVSGEISDAQIAALAMAVHLRGMDAEETAALTLAMRDSGRVLAWPGMPGPVVDKHSTGGVGDKVSLLLAPILAACGAYVPMISGRGLGHTGGTLDKLESIPGYDTRPAVERFQRILREVGCAIVGQTPDLAPADGRIYAVRDVTATVESVPLITASILAKKLAEGIEALVMDVKVGSGAFLPECARARELARTLVAVAAAAGLPCCALLTDMNRVLGRTAGNALEVAEAVRALRGEGTDPRLEEVTFALAGELLAMSGLARDVGEGRMRAQAALSSGAAAERFAKMVHALGGPADFVESFEAQLPRAPLVRAVPAPRSGFITAVNLRALGLAVVALGGGRTRVEDRIDHAVGITDPSPPGAEIRAGDPLCVLHARDEARFEAAAAMVVAACRIGDRPPPETPVIYERLSG